MDISNDKLPEAENETPLIDLIFVLFERWRVLVAMPVVAALATWGMASGLPNEWEAQAILEVGTVGTVGAGGLTRIESAPLLLERIKLRETRMRAGQALGLARDSQEIERFVDAITAKQVKNTDLVALKVRAVSREDAEKYALAVIQVVREGQSKEIEHIQKLISRRLKERQHELDALKAQIRIYREQDRTSQKLPERVYDEYKHFAAIYLANLEIRMHQLDSETAELKMMASLPTDRPTQLFGSAVNMTTSLVGPRRGLFAVLAWLIVLSLGLLFVFIQRALRNAGRNAEAADKLAKIRVLKLLKRG